MVDRPFHPRQPFGCARGAGGAGNPVSYTHLDYISLYIGGSIQHFNQYIMDPGPSNKIWGQECFPNVYSFLWDIGIKLYKGNVYLDFRQLNNETRGNVYTFFRRPLQDFGLLGMYLFTFLVAVFFAYCYYKKISNHRASYRCDQRILFYSYCFYEIVMASIEQMCFSYVSIGDVYKRQNIDRSTIQFDFAVNSNSLLPQRDEIERLGGRIFLLPSTSNVIQYVFRLYSILKTEKYKVIHCHMNTLNLFPLFSAWCAKVPVRICHNHSTADKQEGVRAVSYTHLDVYKRQC